MRKPSIKRPQNQTAEFIEIARTIMGRKIPPVALVTVTGTQFADTQSTGQNPTGSTGADRRTLTVANNSSSTFDLSPSSEYNGFVIEGKFVRGTKRGTFTINGWHDGTTPSVGMGSVAGDDPGISSVAGVIAAGTLTITITTDTSGNSLVLDFEIRAY